MDPDKNFYNEAKIAKITKTALIFFSSDLSNGHRQPSKIGNVLENKAMFD